MLTIAVQHAGIARRPGLIPPTRSFQRLIPVDAGSLFSRRGERREAAQTQFLPSRANVESPTPRICSGEPRQSPRAASEAPRHRQSPAAAAPTRRSRGAPAALGTVTRPPGRATPGSPCPTRLRGSGPAARPLSSPRGGLGAAIQARAQPAAAGEETGKG